MEPVPYSGYPMGFPAFALFDPQLPAAHPAQDAKIEATLAEAQRLVQEEQFSQALRVILEAVNMCPCEPAGEGKQRHAKDKSCHIAQCMGAVNSGEPFALYEVAQSLCTCGYRWPSCGRQLHAKALDALADCLDKAEQYVAAFATALAIIRLDPASAVGYCRGARIIRYLLKSASPNPSSARGRAVALILDGHAGAPSAILLRAVLGRFVQAGLRITDRYRRGPKDTFNVGGSIPIPFDTRDWSAHRFSQVVLRRMAYHLKCDTALRDPVKEFPREVLGMVFSLLDTTDLVQCLRVNKQWNRLAVQDDSWNDLKLKRPGNPGKFFPQFLQQHQQIKSLVITDASKFNLMSPRFCRMVFGLRQLDRLCIGFGKRRHVPLTLELDATKATTRPRPHLTQLSLEAFDLKTPVAPLLSLNADTLVTLNLINTGPGVSDVFDAVSLLNLKKLRMTAGIAPALHHGSSLIEMEPVVMATPNLEQLHLDGFQATWHRTKPPTTDWNGLWLSLRKLTLGPGMLCVKKLNYSMWNPRFLPPFSTSLQSLEILGSSLDVAQNVLFTTTSPAATTDLTALLNGDLIDLDLPNLEVFRCLSNILKPSHLERILKPAASGNKLQALELRAAFARLAPPSPGDPPGDFVPARDLPFLECNSLHTLGLHEFNFYQDPNSRYSATDEFDAEPFVQWLDCFPGLHTLGVYPGGWEAVGTLIVKLIVRPGIQTIHQQSLNGVSWDAAQKLAKKHGVDLRHTPGRMPAGWRLFDDMDDGPFTN